jgi:hypothetical protein
MSFLKALAKVGLVELDEREQARLQTTEEGSAVDDAALDRILARADGSAHDEGAIAGAPTRAAPRIDAQAAADTLASAEIAEGRPFDDLYREAAITASPFPAEKLLRLLDGLRAMDPATRKTAVTAMDAADETWAIEDAVLDAQRKMRALADVKTRLARQVAAAETTARTETEEQDRYQERAVASIRQQIAQLEKLMETEIGKVAEHKAAAHARLQATRDACARETARCEAETRRLQEIPHTFAPQGPEPTTPQATPRKPR